MRFHTSDTHFGHERIIPLCNRPFRNVPEMNREMIARWNAFVDPEDIVFHHGDVALGPWAEWDGILTRLNGYKILVVGNHDRVFKGMGHKQNVKFASQYARWFDEVIDNGYAMELADGSVVNLSHFPYDGDSHEGDRYREYRLRDDGRILLHGHTHSHEKVSRSTEGTLQIHVGVDAWDYRPVSEDEIINIIQEES